jgi:L-lactate dehydrogenase
MKVGIVGMGAVGAATAMAIAIRAYVRELVLINRTRTRSKAVAADMRYGISQPPLVKIVDGDYGDLTGASLVIITAGVNERAGGATDRSDPAGRLRLLGRNVKVFEEIVPQIVQAAPRAAILVVTDPPEPLVEVARYIAGHERVLGTSTYLDSLRFRAHLAQRLGVSPASIDATVVGEHGTSSVFLWSSARVGGMKVQDMLARRRIEIDELRTSVEHDVRYANISIIEGIGASQYGIGMAAGHIAEAIVRDERAVFPVGSHNRHFGVTLSLPCIVGRSGVSEVLWPEMSHEEEQAIEHSADILRAAVSRFIA